MTRTPPIDLSEARRRPVTEVVELLEHWLERARAGEVRAVAVAGDMADGTVESAYHVGGSLPGLLFAVGTLDRALWAHGTEA